MEEITEVQVEEFLDKKIKSLKMIKPNICEFMFPPFNSFEATVESDYLGYLSESEKNSMIFKVKKKYADSNYEGDLLEEKRHGLGRMYYDSGRYYFGE